MSRVPLTKDGEVAIKKKLANLKFVERPRVSASIAEARAHGDLKENAEYHAAKEQQSFAEGRIQDIKLKLSNSEIVDPKKITSSKVVFSAKVDLYDFEKEIEATYSIVGDDEADIKISLISVNSPIARSLIGKEKGDTVFAETPSGKKEFEILKISYE